MSAPRPALPEKGFHLPHLLRFLARIDRPARLLVAVSGGSDSLGLLLGLHHLLTQPAFSSIELIAATIDHGLRAASGAEAETVGRICARHRIPHHIRRWEGEKPSSGLSAAAREARYGLLADLAAEIGANAILTGHTAEDQAETVSMRALRRGPEPLADMPLGLSGMADHLLFDRRIWIYRPLLDASRQDMRAFLQQLGETWVDDPSNSNPAFERARIRLGQQPAENPSTFSPLARAALMRQAAACLERHVRFPLPGLAAVEASAFHKAGVRPMLSVLVATLGGLAHGPGMEALSTLMALGEKPPGSRITLGRCLIHRHKAAVLITREQRGLPSILVAPGKRCIWDGRFAVRNWGKSTISLGPAKQPPEKSGESTRGLPASLITLARQTQPDPADNLEISPIIAPYCRFLPGFDLALAEKLSELMGAGIVPAQPF
ncbi:tRNA lysidine(34) synthetase TilS [Rhizobium paknamense]|uniref:tRNA(Ile)-lysidine synthase n=1 Tax=Rhizobium paknamense TaxID=1206817 RepID=A0ABU0IFN5_9HYPH|nr:tRNA lysidine(34) synthetase TilS [Rhizobium paknamense]MDQ0457050.1 tRNA(Ile)-lysidine synthase [Rhizobium paknamense]